MAERYRREKGLPAYQPGDLSGFFAGAQETGRQAAAVGQQAQAIGQQARVLENVGQQFSRWGADLARQHGQQKPVGPMRDKDGNMVPLVQRATLNISDQVYQQREARAWHASALNLYKERSQTEAERFRMDPEGYANAMTEVREQILANAPGSISSELASQMESFSVEVSGGIDSFVNKQERQSRDLSIEQGVDRATSSFLVGAIRDGESLWDLADPTQPNQELYGPESDVGQAFASLQGLSVGEDPDDEFTPVHDALAAEINRKGLLAWFDSKANGARQMFATDPSRAQNTLLQLQRMIEDDEVNVPGWAGKYSEGMAKGGINFSNLTREAQQTLRTEIGRLSERIVAEAGFKNDFEHEMFQEELATDMQALSKDIPTKIPDERLRGHIERWAGARGVPPALVYSMIHRESGYDPGAKSVTGVVGLMQVTHATGKRMSKELGEKEYNADRTDPYASTKYGIAYLGKMLGFAERYCPECNQLQKEYLASAAYNQGEGTLALLLNKGADLSNPQQWMEVLRGIVIRDKGKVMFDGPQAANHAEKVMRSRMAMTNGGMALMEMTSQRAAERFPNPRDYMRAMNRFHKNWTQANSMRQYNANLVYQPPPYDMDMARAFVDEQWIKRYDPGAPNIAVMAGETAKSIVKLVQGDTEYGHMVQMAAYEKLNKIARSGNTQQAKNAQKLLSMQGGARQTLGDAKTNDKNLPGGTNPNVLMEFLEGAEAGQPMAAHAMNRHTIGGRKTNGRLGIETMTLTEEGLRSLASSHWTERQTDQFLSFLDQLYGGAPAGAGYFFSKDVQPAAEAAWTSRENMARLFPGQSGSGANMLAAIDFARDHKELLASHDKDTKEQLHRLLNGRPLKDRWDTLGPDGQTELSKLAYQSVIAGLPRFRRELQGTGQLESMAQVSSAIPTALVRESLNFREHLTKATAPSAFEFGRESVYKRGTVGYSKYTYDTGVVSNQGYNPTKNAAVMHPIDNHLHPLSMVEYDQFQQFGNTQMTTDEGETAPLRTVQISGAEFDAQGRRIRETVPLVRGTLIGAAQAALDDKDIRDDQGNIIDAAQAMRDGNLKFFIVDHVVSPEGRPAVILQTMMQTRIPGTYEGEWTEAVAFDTGEMIDIASTPEFAMAHQQSAALSAPFIDVSRAYGMAMNLIQGPRRYEQPYYGEEDVAQWGPITFEPLGSFLREEGRMMGSAAMALTPLQRGFFESEEIPERFTIREGEIEGEGR